MPNGRTLQVASCHHYRDQWAKAFDVTYEDLEAKQAFCHQTTYGMSERLLGAVVGMHGDENGLIMPPKIAPFQVVICPMIRKNLEVDTVAAAHEVAEQLRSRGLRVKVDDRDLHPRAEVLRLGDQGRSTALGYRTSRHRTRNRFCRSSNRWKRTVADGLHR